MPTPAESGFRHGWSTMHKLRVGMPPTIFAIMTQMAKVLLKLIIPAKLELVLAGQKSYPCQSH